MCLNIGDLANLKVPEPCMGLSIPVLMKNLHGVW